MCSTNIINSFKKTGTVITLIGYVLFCSNPSKPPEVQYRNANPIGSLHVFFGFIDAVTTEYNNMFSRLRADIEIQSEGVFRCRRFSTDLVNLGNNSNHFSVGCHKVQEVLKYSDLLKSSKIVFSFLYKSLALTLKIDSWFHY